MGLDYASILQAGQNLVPDLQQEMLQRQELQMRRDLMAQKMQAARERQARQAELQASLARALDAGDARSLGRLMAEFPEFSEGMKPAFEALSNEQKMRNLTQLGSAYQLAQAGDYKGAASILQRRHDADVAAGQGDETTKELLDYLGSDDPGLQRRASTMIGGIIAGLDPAKFDQNYKALFPTERSSATLAEYDQRVAKFGKAAADKWLAVQDAKLVPVQKGGSVYSAADLVTPGLNVPDAALGSGSGIVATPAQEAESERFRQMFPDAPEYAQADPRDGVEPPTLGQNGFPAALTPEQYRATVQAMGKAETDSWMQRNGITMADAAQQGAPTTSAVRVRSKQQYDRLPKGTRYIAPDGSERVKG